MSTQVKPIPDKSQVSTVSGEPVKHSPEIKFPAAPPQGEEKKEIIKIEGHQGVAPTHSFSETLGKQEENAREGSAPTLNDVGQLSVERLLDTKYDIGVDTATDSLLDPRSYMFKRKLQEGRIVHYLTPNDWLPNARKQIRAALVVFCYRDAQGAPTGTCNLCIFLNGPQDTGDMLGPKTRCLQFEPGVKFSAEPAGGCWSWPSRS